MHALLAQHQPPLPPDAQFPLPFPLPFPVPLPNLGGWRLPEEAVRCLAKVERAADAVTNFVAHADLFLFVVGAAVTTVVIAASLILFRSRR